MHTRLCDINPARGDTLSGENELSLPAPPSRCVELPQYLASYACHKILLCLRRPTYKVIAFNCTAVIWSVLILTSFRAVVHRVLGRTFLQRPWGTPHLPCSALSQAFQSPQPFGFQLEPSSFCCGFPCLFSSKSGCLHGTHQSHSNKPARPRSSETFATATIESKASVGVCYY